MATITTTFTSFANLSRSGSNGQTWVNASNAQASDNAYANLSGSVVDGYTPYLKCTGLTDLVPAGATITGITITIERKDTGGGPTYDSVVQLVKGGAISGNNKADTTTRWPTGTDANATYGGSADLWGLTGGISVSEINASDFGVVISLTVDDGLASGGGLGGGP